MFRRLKIWLFLRTESVRVAQAYAAAAVQDPTLFRMAWAYVTEKRKRMSESRRRAHQPSWPNERPMNGDAKVIVEALAENIGVLLLRHEGHTLQIGVAETDFLAALRFLDVAARRPRMQIGRRIVRAGSFLFRRRALKAEIVRVFLRQAGVFSGSIFIEPYFKNGPQKWVSAHGVNDLARGLFSDILEKPGLHKIETVLGAPALGNRPDEEPVDVVYTWVNHDDPDWAALFARHKPGAKPVEPETPEVHQSAEASALSRFHSNDELRYSLRSVDYNLPWARQILVFTNCAPPAWFNPNQSRVRWVQHEDAIPPAHLPTFSSHTIESYLHHIPGLAERFLYVNDDVFIARFLARGFFFAPGGQTHSFLEPYGMVSGKTRKGDPDYLNAARNSVKLIREHFGVAPTQLHQHTAFALRKSILADIEKTWPALFEKMRASKFRSISDVNVTSFLYHHYAINKGEALVADINNAFVKSLDIRWKARLAAAESPKFHTICINEGGVERPSPAWHRAVRAFLMKRFPEPASWEREMPT